MGSPFSKYYFRKPKSEIVKDVFLWLFIAGAVAVAASSPYFVVNIINARKRLGKYPKKKVSDTFSRLKRDGSIMMEYKNNQLYISLTKQGRYKAGRFQINHLEIARPKRWDGKYRMLLFDISHKRRVYREALRGKLKELGFYLFQKSAWVHAFDCRAEVVLLKQFFGLSDSEVCLVVIEDIGNDQKLRAFFQL